MALQGLLEDVGGQRWERTFVGVTTMVAKIDIAHKWRLLDPPLLGRLEKGGDWCARLEQPVLRGEGLSLEAQVLGQVMGVPRTEWGTVMLCDC